MELALNTTPIETKDFTWDLNFTYTKNNSKIVELSDLVADYIKLNGEPAYGNYRVGSVAKVGSAYGLILTDSNPAKDYKYDENGAIIEGSGSGKNILQWRDGQRAAQTMRSGRIEEVGSILPKFLGSVNTSFRYKNFTLSASFDMRFGGKVASYGSHYGNAYGYLKSSLAGRDAAHGGLTWTSAYDGVTYDDGVIPDAIILSGTKITQPDGSKYIVGAGSVSPNGESFQELVDKAKIEPLHSATWTYFNNSWGQAVVNDTWFKTLNYIAFRDLSLSYRFDNNIASKLHAKGLSITASAHNLGYLLNSMPNKENPEAVSGTTAAEFRVRQFTGVTTNFTFTINASF